MKARKLSNKEKFAMVLEGLKGAIVSDISLRKMQNLIGTIFIAILSILLLDKLGAVQDYHQIIISGILFFYIFCFCNFSNDYCKIINR